jgi:hypothetical protein
MESIHQLTCINAIEETSNHDHLKGHGRFTQQHHPSTTNGKQVVQQQASLSVKCGGEK